MISPERSLEKLHSNGNHPITTASCDQSTPEETNNTLYSDISTLNSNVITNETFACDSAIDQIAPCFIDVNNDTLGQAYDTWTPSGIGPNWLPCSDRVLCCTEDAQLKSASVVSIPPEANIAGIPDFLFTVQGQNPFVMMPPQQVFTDIHTIADNNPLIQNNIGWENPSKMAAQQFYTDATNRLRHMNFPSSNLPAQQESFFPDLNSELTNNISHHGVSYSSPIEMSNTISSPYLDHNSFSTPNTQYINERSNQFPDSMPKQTSQNFCPHNFVAPSFFSQYLVETRVNTHVYNEIIHSNKIHETSSYSENNNFHQCISKEQRAIFSNYTIPRTDQEVIECSIYPDISGTKPLSHQPFSSVKEPCDKTAAMHEKLKLDTTKPEEAPLCLKKEPSLREQVKAQVDQFVSSPKKARGLKKCSCPVCGRSLARLTTLKIHLRQHSGDRPFKCPLCPKTFAQKSLLNSHRRTHSGERPFSCSLCHKRFAHSSGLKTHTRTHTGERPHLCPVPNCGMAFSDSSTLSKHARVHNGKRPYPCDICGRRFTQSGNMNKHRRTVHSVKNEAKMMKMRENTKILADLLTENDEKSAD